MICMFSLLRFFEKRLKIHFLYAKGFLAISSVLSLLSFWLFYRIGLGALSELIWFKLISNSLLLFVHQRWRAKEIFFYLNVGVGRVGLLTVSFLADFVLWIIGITLIFQLNT
ncbi:MAG: hypothetical protein AAFV25_19385 [Bacteroidota bacterium]